MKEEEKWKKKMEKEIKEKERGKEAIFQEKKAANLLECSHSDQRTAVHAHSQ